MCAVRLNVDETTAIYYIANGNRRELAADLIRRSISKTGKNERPDVDVKVRANVEGIRKAGIVVLAVQPHLLRQLFQEPGVVAALQGKLVVSVMAGVTVQDIKAGLTESTASLTAAEKRDPLIVRVMPNINCFVRQSTTVIERGSVEEDVLRIVSHLFECVGKVFFTEPSTMDACTALCGSSPAFFTVVLEALVDGAISTGLEADEALQMAAHAMMGTASLVQHGWQPTKLRHGVTSPGGSTIQGVLKLEEDRVRWSFAKALEVAAGAAAKLGSK